MVAQMHVEVGDAGESLAAQLTVVGLFPGVCTQVFGEVRAVCEAPATLWAWEGPLPCVTALVHYKIVSLSKALAASVTHVRPLALVAALMAQQRGALAEAASAVATCIWLLPSVRSLVPH